MFSMLRRGQLLWWRCSAIRFLLSGSGRKGGICVDYISVVGAGCLHLARACLCDPSFPIILFIPSFLQVRVEAYVLPSGTQCLSISYGLVISNLTEENMNSCMIANSFQKVTLSSCWVGDRQS